MTSWLWHEMARRKVRFHDDEQWYEIDLWIPLAPSTAKKMNRTNTLLIWG